MIAAGINKNDFSIETFQLDIRAASNGFPKPFPLASSAAISRILHYL
jgi:hypothetical protein